MKTAKSKAVKTPFTGAVIAAVGMDLGDRYSHWCALSADGEVIERGRVKTTAEAMSEQAMSWVGIPVAIENGTHSGWVSRTLDSHGYKVCVANPSAGEGRHTRPRTMPTMRKPWLVWCGWTPSCSTPSCTAHSSSRKTSP